MTEKIELEQTCHIFGLQNLEGGGKVTKYSSKEANKKESLRELVGTWHFFAVGVVVALDRVSMLCFWAK